MKRKQHITAFYLETLLMIVVFISIILVLTRVFGGARARSAEAKRLTAAVTLAQNAAEAVAASADPRELWELLDADGNAVLQEDAATGQALVTAVYDADMKPVPLPEEVRQAAGAWSAESLLRQGDLVVEAAWNPAGEGQAAAGNAEAAGLASPHPVAVSGIDAPSGEAGDASPETGELVDAVVTVFNGKSGEAVFSLHTSVYVPAKDPGSP